MGTWSIPNTMAKARRLAKLLAKPLPAEGATDVLYDLVGDDRLFDSLGEAGGSSDVRYSVARKIEEWDAYYHESPESWRDSISPAVWEVLRRAYKKVLGRSR
jgi:NAD(P)H-dependent FMN reductase